MLSHLRLACAALLLAAPAFAQSMQGPARTARPAPMTAPMTAPTTAPTATPATSPPAALPARQVPAITPSPAGTPAASTGARVDLNSASAADLDALPGVGPARARNIIAARPITDLKELVTKKAIPQSVLDQDRGRMALANINTTSASDLAKILPGIGTVRAAAIVKSRPYASPQDMVSKNVLTQGVYDGIKDLVAY